MEKLYSIYLDADDAIDSISKTMYGDASKSFIAGK